MESRKNKYCKKCKESTIHRLVKESRPNKSNYYSCNKCLSKNSKNYRKRNWLKYLAQKANSRKLPNSTEITEELLKNIHQTQKFKCKLTGVKLDINSKWWKPSLDRIDSSKGYTEDNIRLVAWIVNHCRGNLTDVEFIDMCQKVNHYNK